MSYICEHFQQNILKIYPFSSSKLHKGVNIKIQISKLKNQSSVPQTISGSIYGNSRTWCMSKVFEKFPSGHEVITSCWRHLTLASSRVVIRGLTNGGLLFFTVENVVQTINCLYIKSKTAWHVSNMYTCFKKSKRGISVICWYPGRRLKLDSTKSFPNYCIRNNSLPISNCIWENKPAGLSQHVHIVHFWNLVDTV